MTEVQEEYFNLLSQCQEISFFALSFSIEQPGDVSCAKILPVGYPWERLSEVEVSAGDYRTNCQNEQQQMANTGLGSNKSSRAMSPLAFVPVDKCSVQLEEVSRVAGGILGL